MHLAPPAFLAATLTAWLVPALADAPTSTTSPQRALAARTAVGKIQEPAPPLQDVHVPDWAVHLAQATPPASGPQVQAPSRAGAAQARPPAVDRAAPQNGAAAAQAATVPPCSSVTVEPATSLTLGKAEVVRLPFPVARVIVGGRPSSFGGRPVPLPEAGTAAGAQAAIPGRLPALQQQQQGVYDGMAETDVNLLSPTELFFLARRPGSMNVVLQGTDGRCVAKDLLVTIDPSVLQARLTELMPEETGIKVRAADHSMVLTGTVSDAVKLEHIMSVAGAFGDGKKVVNLLRVGSPQQVMLEVKIAEVSKTLLDRFGLDFTRIVSSGSHTSIISGILGGVPGVLGRFGPNVAGGVINGAAAGSVSSDIAAATASVAAGSRGATLLGADMQKRDGVIRVLAEPNIMAITGQAASFLSGGKIFIPVAQTSVGGFPTITLEEKEFGVGLKFTPTVLDGRVNLKVVTEVSELSQTGTPFTTVGGTTAVLPSLSTRRVDTTVQLADGQSFAVAGLIKNNVTESLNKFPGLGEVPIVGALFRSTEFQNDQTELLFIVTPRLVKPLTTAVALPTDNHVPPTRADVILMGRGEGADPPPATVPAAPGTPMTPPARPPVAGQPPAGPPLPPPPASSQH